MAHYWRNFLVSFLGSSTHTLFIGFRTGDCDSVAIGYSAFQILYILKNRELQTYADILNFLNPKKNVKTSILSELWFVVSVIVIAFIIFFAGTVISALIFHY